MALPEGMVIKASDMKKSDTAAIAERISWEFEMQIIVALHEHPGLNEAELRRWLGLYLSTRRAVDSERKLRG